MELTPQDLQLSDEELIAKIRKNQENVRKEIEIGYLVNETYYKLFNFIYSVKGNLQSYGINGYRFSYNRSIESQLNVINMWKAQLTEIEEILEKAQELKGQL